MSDRGVDPEFFDLEIYSIYTAIYKHLGERTWDIVWRSGEILYREIKDKLNLAEVKDPFEGLRRLSRWLRDVGYIDDIEVIKKGEDTLEYHMSNPIIEKGAKRLIDSGKVPPHISTSLMFALLKDYGYRAEMLGEPIFEREGYVVERWRLVKLSDEDGSL
jgi:hypothetical protein